MKIETVPKIDYWLNLIPPENVLTIREKSLGIFPGRKSSNPC